MYVQSPVVVHSISSSHSPLPLPLPLPLPRFGAHLAANSKSLTPPRPPSTTFFPNPPPISNSKALQPKSTTSSDSTSLPVTDDDDDDDEDDVEVEITKLGENDVEVEITKLGENARRIICRIGVDANLGSVWKVLTDYERLADFIPGLAVCQLLEKSGNRARLFQIGQQNLAFGLKFNAKGIVDCYEKDLERAPFGERRDIEFKMIEGDFQVFEGKWSIEEIGNASKEVSKTSIEHDFQTTLSYIVDVKPKLWLPVRLVEARLCREIRLNLVCIKQQAEKAV